jgi:three-Cys-motif partner protein
MREDFFEEPLEQSKVKSQIVAKYFDAWAQIIASRANKVAYVDLFAGQGYYEDGTDSTPLLVLKKAIENPRIGQKLLSEFNDQDIDHVQSLRQAVYELDGIENLPNAPTFSNITVSKKIVQRYDKMRLIPTLLFLDPWGYKGVSLDLIKVAIKDWASECVLFFNYKRINMDLQKPVVHKNINDLFGKNRADKLRERTAGMQPYRREETIIQEFCEALKEMGGQYTLPFCFRDRRRDRTSHYLIHASKHPLGYGLMKEIMEGYSVKDADGVPTFTFDPKNQLTLNFNQPLRELAKQVSRAFKCQSLKVKDVYKKHQETSRFTKRNYRDALLLLEEKHKIKVDVPAEGRRIRSGKRTLGDDRVVTFIS